MTDSGYERSGKRDRLAAAAATVIHEKGVASTRLADIAQAADVPVGNVYYYFKTKDQLVEAAIEAHRAHLETTLARLQDRPTPQERLKGLVQEWVDQRDLATRFGCPTGTLASELDKRRDGLDQRVADLMHELVDWAERQFRAMGRADSAELAIALVSAYQGISLLTNTFRDPELMVVEGRRLQSWIDSLG